MNTESNNLKVIFCGFNYHVNNQFIKCFLNKFNVAKYITVNTGPESNINYQYNLFKYGKFFKYFDWSKIPKIDPDLFSDLKNEEPVVIDMLARINPKMKLEERKLFYYNQLRYWDFIIEREQINLFLSDNIPHDGFDYIIFLICKYRKIQTIMFHELPTRPYKHMSMHATDNIEQIGKNIYEKFIDYKSNSKSYSGTLSKRLLDYYEEMQEEGSDIEQFTQKQKRKNLYRETIDLFSRNYRSLIENMHVDINIAKKRRIRWYIIAIDILKANFKKIFPFLRRILFFFLYNTKIYLSEYDYYKRLCTQNIDLNKKFIYFALHYQPELSTSPLAKEFTNQLLITKTISESLPDDVYLYIKEHPRISYNRNRNFYDKMISMKNVVFCDPDISTYKLIDQSVAVATATGSVGWEAFLRSKPVLMFGYRFYQYAPNVFRVFNTADCTKALNEILNKTILINKEEILLYLEALDKYTFYGYNTKSKEKFYNLTNKENVNNYINAIINYI